MPNTYSKGSFFIIIGICVFAYVYNNTVAKSFTKKLVASHFVTCGTITQMLGGKSINIVFEFYYKNKRYEYTKSPSKPTYDKYKNGKSGIMIVFEKEDPDNNRIVSRDEDFLTYGITEQDTLNTSCY